MSQDKRGTETKHKEIKTALTIVGKRAPLNLSVNGASLKTSYPSLAPKEQENSGILPFFNRLSKSKNKNPLRDEKRTIQEEPGDAGAASGREESGRKGRRPQGRRWRYTIRVSNLPLPSAHSRLPSFPKATSGACPWHIFLETRWGRGLAFSNKG